jgi:hypothetical protein
VFLDCLLAHVAISDVAAQSHLLDRRFAVDLSTPELELRAHVEDSLSRAPPGMVRSSSFPLLVELLHELGMAGANKRHRHHRRLPRGGGDGRAVASLGDFLYRVVSRNAPADDAVSRKLDASFSS